MTKKAILFMLAIAAMSYATEYLFSSYGCSLTYDSFSKKFSFESNCPKLELEKDMYFDLRCYLNGDVSYHNVQRIDFTWDKRGFFYSARRFNPKTAFEERVDEYTMDHFNKDIDNGLVGDCFFKPVYTTKVSVKK